MKRVNLNQRARYVITCLFLLAGLGFAPRAWSQNQKVKITGTIYEVDNNKTVPLPYATIAIPDMAIGATTNMNGKYELLNVPTGKVHLSIQFLGKVTIDTLVNVTKNMTLNFTMKNQDFKLKEVVVTATNSRAGKSTASHISRTAMDHMQATSLNDIMALMPGGMTTNSTLSGAQQINIRQVSSTNINALGTAVIRDGAPISNNANLSTLSPTLNGSGSALAGGASATGGTDVRSISTENIESVEVIRGIPSVEYGDLTSGAVLITTKAGREPLRVKAKANPNVYQASFGKGFELGGKKGALNLSADYAYNTNKITASYIHYQRATAKALYSNEWGKLRSNTSFDFIYGQDEREPNPDDENNQIVSEGRDLGFTLNTNGTFRINWGWLKTIKYVVSGTYTDKQSHYEALHTNATYPYSGTMTDGAILNNMGLSSMPYLTPVYDADGNITGYDNHTLNFPNAGGYKANLLPAQYVGIYDIDSREVNVFAKATATLFKQAGNVSNRIIAGADFKTDGNVGEGKTWDPSCPPYRNLSYYNSTFRPRSYKDIPFINQFGAFFENNFKWSIGGTHDFQLQAGVRFDNASVVGSTISPRFNASMEIIPNKLSIFGGYGVTAKMPTLLYLYPENAYFEYIHLNEMSTTSIPEADRKFITTTRVFEVDNSDLEITKNYKAEAGFRLNLGKMSLNVTGYHERLKNGYTMGQTLDTYKSVNWTTYTRKNIDGEYQYVASTNPVLSYYNAPTNNMNVENTGIEWDLNMGRIDAIRTSFNLSGAWMRTKVWNDGYEFYASDGEAANKRTPVAIYEKSGTKSYDERLATTLRATHNIPEIGLVVTLSAQAVLQERDWATYGNDSIPVGYISLDGKTNWFKGNEFKTAEELKNSEYGYMWRSVSHSSAIKQGLDPYFQFNLNVTKEISDMLRVSFFANNMFRSYPKTASKRSLGSFLTGYTNRFFFGLEMSLTL